MISLDGSSVYFLLYKKQILIWTLRLFLVIDADFKLTIKCAISATVSVKCLHIDSRLLNITVGVTAFITLHSLIN